MAEGKEQAQRILEAKKEMLGELRRLSEKKGRREEDQSHEEMKKRFSSYMGRLDMLGRVPKKYHEAVLAAASGPLKSYVLMESNDLVSFMGSSTLHGNVLCLEELVKRNSYITKPLGLPEVRHRGERVPYLIDLVEIDDKGREAEIRALFRFAFKGTLVAKDFDTAHEIIERSQARGETVRIVTLEGDTLSSNGTMHTVPQGCYCYVHTYLTESKREESREEEERKLTREVGEVEEEYFEMQNRLIGLQREVSKLKERLPQEGDFYRLEMIMKNLRHRREMLVRERERVRVAEGREEEIKLKMDEAQKTVESKEEELLRAEGVRAKKEEEMAQARASRRAVEGEDLTKLEEEIN